MGRIDKGVSCSVRGCYNSAMRSLSKVDATKAELEITGEGRRVYLCRTHYKEWKKRLKARGLTPARDLRWVR